MEPLKSQADELYELRRIEYKKWNKKDAKY